MAFQTITLASSFTPKLATFNSPTPTLLPLPPPRSFSCSSSLPTPCLKASYGMIRVLQTSRDFKCYVSTPTTDGVPAATPDPGLIHVVMPGAFIPIPDVDHNEKVQELGKFAVEEHNKRARTNIKFIRVVEAESQVVSGMNYRMMIQGEVGKVDNVYKAIVFIGLPVCPKELEFFKEVEWINDPVFRKALLEA